MLRGAFQRAMSGEERAWRVWWLWGVPAALAASALAMGAEALRTDGLHGAGALTDTFKVLVHAAWFVAAWRCARNTEHAAWMFTGRFVAALGVALVAITA